MCIRSVVWKHTRNMFTNMLLGCFHNNITSSTTYYDCILYSVRCWEAESFFFHFFYFVCSQCRHTMRNIFEAETSPVLRTEIYSFFFSILIFIWILFNQQNIAECKRSIGNQFLGYVKTISLSVDSSPFVLCCCCFVIIIHIYNLAHVLHENECSMALHASFIVPYSSRINVISLT